jgi:hypothetical protein
VRSKGVGKGVERSVKGKKGDKGVFSFIIKVFKNIIFFVSQC